MKTGASFYVTGGTVPTDALSYVPRQADADLVEGLLAGEFCYVLNTRQMGKSSLMVRAADRLRELGSTVAVLDLTALGQNVTVEQWYDGLMDQTGRELGLDDELDEYRVAHRHLGPMQRWIQALRDVVLPRCSGSLVVFVDEIDAVRSLPFSTDEFFAGIRACYNLRAQSPELGRLNFCLLGVATPASLVRDTRMTPFNIGRRIDVHDFTETEAASLAEGFNGSRPRAEILRRVLYWTGGHPYLTQRLCQAVANDAGATCSRDVDRLCEALFLSRRAQERDDNLLFVRDRILRGDTDVSGVLDLYEQIRTGKRVRSDDLRPGVSALLLAGLVREAGLYLRTRNRIYARVFNGAWVHDRLPGAEIRRQRAAYRRGLIRATAAATAIVLAMGVLAMIAMGYSQRAQQNARQLRRSLSERNSLVNRLTQALAEANRQHKRADQERQIAIGRESEARQAEGVATQKQIEALRLQKIADAKARESQNRLIRLATSNGARRLDEDDIYGSLLWFTEAAKLDRSNSREASLHDLRLASALHYAPRLQQMWFGVRSARLNGPGTRVVLAGSDGTARVYDVPTGMPMGAPIYHGRELKLAVLSPDGRRALTVGKADARLWDVVSHKSRHVAYAEEAILGAAFSPDSRQLAVSVQDNWARDTGYIQMLDAASGTPIRTLGEGKGCMSELTFSEDGHRLIGQHYNAYIWDTISGLQVATLAAKDTVAHMKLSRDGRWLVAGYDHGLVQWFATETHSTVFAVRHRAQIRSMCISPDGRRLATASADGTARIWNVSTAEPAAPPLRHASGVECVSFSPDGRCIATGGADSVARIWEAATGEPLSPWLPHSGPVTWLAFDSTGRRLLTTDSAGVARIWDIATGGPDRFVGEYGNVNCAAYSPDGRRLATGDYDWSAREWDAATGRPITPPMIHGRQVTAITYSPDGKRLATVSQDGYGRIWNPATGKLLAALPHRPGHSGLETVAFSPDGRHIATASEYDVVLWDCATGRRICKINWFGEYVRGIAFSSDGRRIATAHGDDPAGVDPTERTRSVRIWNAANGAALTVLPQNANVNSVDFSPDGQQLLTTSADGSARLWDLTKPRPTARTLYAGQTVLNAIFSRDGRRILTSSGDLTTNYRGEARMWSAATGEPLGPALTHRGPVLSATWSQDGRLIATCAADCTARVWDAASGDPVTPPLRHGKPVGRALFQPGAQRLLTLCRDGVARIWDLPASTPSIDRLEPLARVLAARRTDGGGDLSPLPPAAIQSVWKALSGSQSHEVAAAERQILAWHLQEATVGMDAGDWLLALTHLDPLTRAMPRDRQVHLLRAEAYAELGQWARASVEQAELGVPGARVIVLAAHEHVRATCRDKPLRIGNKTFSDGLACNSASRLMVFLPAAGIRFSAIAAAAIGRDAAIDFSVRVPGKGAPPAREWKVGTEPVSLSVPLNGASAFVLEIRHGSLSTPTAWTSARVQLVDGRVLSLADLPIVPANEL